MDLVTLAAEAASDEGFVSFATPNWVWVPSWPWWRAC